MHAGDIDRWTKLLAQAALSELRRQGHPPVSSVLVGDLSQGIRAVLAREIPDVSKTRTLPPGISDELALTIYLLVTARGEREDPNPRILASLGSGLTRTLRNLVSAPAETDPRRS